MAALSFAEAVTAALTREMARDETVVVLGGPVAAGEAGEGLRQKFGPERVVETAAGGPAVVGAGLGAALAGLRPVVAVPAGGAGSCPDLVAREVGRARAAAGRPIGVPLVIRLVGGPGGGGPDGGLEVWTAAVPGLAVVAPSTPGDVVALLAAAVRGDGPVLFVEDPRLAGTVGEVPDGEPAGTLGAAAVRRPGRDVTIAALGVTVPVATAAAAVLAAGGIDAEVVDLRSLVPLDVETVTGSVTRTARLVTVEDASRLRGWGAEVASIVADACLFDLDGPIVRVTVADEPAAAGAWPGRLPSVSSVVDGVRRALA